MTFALVRDVAERNVKSLYFFPIGVLHIESVTAIKYSQWSSSYGTHPESGGPGFDFQLRQRMFSDYVSNSTQLHLVANVISEPKMHNDILSLLEG